MDQSNMKCHICENETDFTCDGCDEPVCEDCCVLMTIHNQIDYPLCTLCGDFREGEKARHYLRKEAEKAKIKAEKDAKNAKRRANYRKPENVAKRKAKREERKRQQAELAKKRIENLGKIISSMFRNM